MASNTPTMKAATRVDGARTDRLSGLSTTARTLALRAMSEIGAERFAEAAEPLEGALQLAPTHAELLRLHGVASYRLHHYADAIVALEAAAFEWPDDPLILNDLGVALAGAKRLGDAIAVWRRAGEVAPEFGLAWFNLGRHLRDEGRLAASEAPLRRAVELMPDHWRARLVLAGALVQLGHVEEAAAAMRRVIAEHPSVGRAWFELSDIKTVRLDDDEVAALSAEFARPDLDESDRVAMAFALGKALEDRGRYAEAFAYFGEGNARMSRRVRWNPHGFPQLVRAIVAASGATRARADDASLGADAIFVVSMPRSGSTLVEQILSTHSAVEGAGELPILGPVIAEESERRGLAFPDWVRSATSADWTRLGKRYLALAAGRRTGVRRFTDKMPTNWMLVGAIRAMLPGARIVNCRRDALETCWSCYKQLFTFGQEYTYDLGHLAVYRRAYENAIDAWSARHATHFRDQRYEALLAEPESEIRALLAFCGLPYEDACLRFHENARSVQTPSAAQVRQPLQRDTARAIHYGKLLDPLRRALAATDTVRPS